MMKVELKCDRISTCKRLVLHKNYAALPGPQGQHDSSSLSALFKSECRLKLLWPLEDFNETKICNLAFKSKKPQHNASSLLAFKYGTSGGSTIVTELEKKRTPFPVIVSAVFHIRLTHGRDVTAVISFFFVLSFLLLSLYVVFVIVF